MMKKPMMMLAALRAVFLGTALLIAGFPAAASDYPEKPITLVVPFAPGGTTDILARYLAERLRTALGQQVIIDNRAGAGGNIGAAAVAKAAPDGYTLLMGYVGTNSINPSLYRNLPFDPVKGFEPVSLVARVTNVVVVNPAVPANNIKELIALAKAKPGQLTYASAGNGSVFHLAGELFKTKVGVDLVHVPYKGAAPALTDLIGGQVSIMFSTMPTAMSYIKSKKLKVLAVMDAERSPALAGVPTVVESGIPDYVIDSWFGILAPAKTPKPIVARLNAELSKMLASPDMQKLFAEQGAKAVSSTPEQFGELIKNDIATWAPLVKQSGAVLD